MTTFSLNNSPQTVTVLHVESVPLSPSEFGARTSSTSDDELVSRTVSKSVLYHAIVITLRIVEQRSVPVNPMMKGLS